MAEEKQNPKTKMDNPYEGIDQGDVHISRGFSKILIVVFLLLCTIPPIGRHIYEITKEKDQWIPVVELFKAPNAKSEKYLKARKDADPRVTDTSPSIQDHLQSFEKEGVEKADFTDPPRSVIQSFFTSTFREGNRKAYIGRDGWFFYGPALEGLTGYGPLKFEPDTVAKDPNRPPFTQSREAIIDFAKKLAERDIQLLLVPVPVKPMIYPEMITGTEFSAPLHHPDQAALYTELEAAGVNVLDLSDAFWKLKAEQQVFLKQDTHWTSAAMAAAADLVAAETRSLNIPLGGLTTTTETISRTHIGDLVQKLNLPNESAFPLETEDLTIIRDTATGKLLAKQNPGSPITLLGDSFVNIFDDPTIGFSNPDWEKVNDDDKEPPIGAGFAARLAHNLQTPLNIFATNGKGASGVRQDFARVLNSTASDTKLVIWTLASRDLLLSEGAAGKASVKWRLTNFPPKTTPAIAETTDPTPPIPPKEIPPAPEGIAATVLATITAKSSVVDPSTVPYPDSLYSAKIKIDQVTSGDASLLDQEVLGMFWGFKKHEYVSTSQLKVGDQLSLTLSLFNSHPDLQSINKSDDFFDYFGTIYLAEPPKDENNKEESEQAEEKEEESPPSPLPILP